MYSRWITFSLIYAAMMLNCMAVAEAQTTQPSVSGREMIANALQRRAAYWPVGELETFLDRIDATLAEKGRTLDQQTAADIVEGLRIVDGGSNVRLEAHPLLVRRYQEQLIHEVRNYLVLGRTDPEVTKVAIAQMMELLDWLEGELLAAYPARTEEIRDAIGTYRRMVTRDARNPFFASMRKPIEPQAIEEAKKEWREAFARLQPDGGTSINMAVSTGFIIALNGSLAPRLPGSESYRKAHDEAWKNIEQINAWQEQEQEKERAEQDAAATQKLMESQNPNGRTNDE